MWDHLTVLDIHATCFTTSALLPGVGTYNTTIVMVFFCQLTLTDSCLRKPTTWLAGIAPPLGKVERARPSLTFATSRGGDARRSPPELFFMTVHCPRNLDICINTNSRAAYTSIPLVLEAKFAILARTWPIPAN
jgi:hypothetical protein